MNHYDENERYLPMKNKSIQRAFSLAICLCVLLSVFTTKTAAATPAPALLPENTEVASRLLELFFGTRKKEEDDPSEERKMLIPAGTLFGIRIETDGVIVAEVNGKNASNLRTGDILIAVDGAPLTRAEDLPARLKNKESVTLTVKRGKSTLTLNARLSDGLLGISVKDTVAGIGTVTFIDPESGVFGGLGHGICSTVDGELTPMRQGTVTDVTLGGVTRGEEGKPGELCGILRHNALGTLSQNHTCGVFGTLNTIPEGTEPLPLAYKNEVKEGAAKIISTVRAGHTAAYDVTLSQIDYASDGTKSFTIHVEDPALIALTGGIVRGMSGSPIVQDGKLVGAVTHVMVNDPTTGYGIFIENMLNAAQMPMQRAA